IFMMPQETAFGSRYIESICSLPGYLPGVYEHSQASGNREGRNSPGEPYGGFPDSNTCPQYRGGTLLRRCTVQMRRQHVLGSSVIFRPGNPPGFSVDTCDGGPVAR